MLQSKYYSGSVIGDAAKCDSHEAWSWITHPPVFNCTKLPRLLLVAWRCAGVGRSWLTNSMGLLASWYACTIVTWWPWFWCLDRAAPASKSSVPSAHIWPQNPTQHPTQVRRSLLIAPTSKLFARADAILRKAVVMTQQPTQHDGQLVVPIASQKVASHPVLVCALCWSLIPPQDDHLRILIWTQIPSAHCFRVNSCATRLLFMLPTNCCMNVLIVYRDTEYTCQLIRVRSYYSHDGYLPPFK